MIGANFLIYAPPGRGKTYLLGTAGQDPRLSPILVIDVDGGALTLQGAPGVTVRPFEGWDTLNQAYQEIMSPGNPWKSFAVDSLTFLHSKALRMIVEKNPAVVDFGVAPIPQIQDYGVALLQMEKVVSFFREVPIPVFFTCLSTEEEIQGEGYVKKPTLIGKAEGSLPGMVDIVGYLGMTRANPPDRVLLLRPSSDLRTRGRSPWGVTPPARLESPTAGKLLDLVQAMTLTQGSKSESN